MKNDRVWIMGYQKDPSIADVLIKASCFCRLDTFRAPGLFNERIVEEETSNGKCCFESSPSPLIF